MHRKACTDIEKTKKLVDCKKVLFSSKSVKKSVKCAVRVLRARSARTSHACRACEARGKKFSPQVSLSVFSLVPDLLFDCSRVLEYAKIRTVLQSKRLEYGKGKEL